MRIGILTFHRAYNCGAMLQAWALQTVLERMGHVVEFPDLNYVGDACRLVLWRKGALGKLRNFLGWVYAQHRGKWVNFRRKMAFGRFMDKNLCHKPFEGWNKYDLVVVGSDQVWGSRCVGETELPLFLGKGIDDTLPLIGYALSAGDGGVPEKDVERLKSAVKRFSAVSFRESLLRDALGAIGPVVCDPTLLLRRPDYSKIEDKRRLCSSPYLFVYAVSDVAEILPKAKEVSEKLGLKLIVADIYRSPRKSSTVKNDCWALTPDKLLAYVRDAEYVIVSSFHGCVFSILYQKRFVCLYGSTTGGNDQEGRQQNLLSRLGLLNHRLAFDASVEDIVTAMRVSCRVGAELDALTSESMAYLNKSVDSRCSD